MGRRSLKPLLSSGLCQSKVGKAKPLKSCFTSCQPPTESDGSGSTGSSLASSPQQSEGSHPREKGQTTPDTEAAGEFPSPSQPLPPWLCPASDLLPKVLLGLGLASHCFEAPPMYQALCWDDTSALGLPFSWQPPTSAPWPHQGICSSLPKYLFSNPDDVGSKSQDVSLCLEDIMEKLRHAFPSVRSSDVTANTLLAS